MTNDSARAGCVICDLISGRMPTWIVYQDDAVVCFLPRDLSAYGHTVIAPIEHVADIYAAPPETFGRVIEAAQTLALHYRERSGAPGMNLLHASGQAAQQSVPHLHFHLIPRFENDDLDAWPPFGPAREFDEGSLLELLRLPGQPER